MPESVTPDSLVNADCFRNWLSVRTGQTFGCSIHGSHGEPIISSPAKHTANRPESNHGEEAVKRMQFARFKLKRIAARASSAEEHTGQPIRPSHGCSIHLEIPFSEMTACITVQPRLPNRDLLPTTREGHGCYQWPGRYTSRLHRSRD
jgi:hypothetical protein